MFKTSIDKPDRVRVYWDGAALQAYAEARGDLSLNWLDLDALACPGGVSACTVWIAPGDPSTTVQRDADLAYERVLRARGVDCRTSLGGGLETECLRCGHGWRDMRPSSEMALALAVLTDAVEDAWDVAFLFAGERAVKAISASLARLFPAKRIGRVTFGPSLRLRLGAGTFVVRPSHLEAARLPPVVRTHGGALIGQPAHWRSHAPPLIQSA
jgi:hypothetical protein